ncbi:NAD(+)/NADH kinase, partial [Chloroflexota bacterium]
MNKVGILYHPIIKAAHTKSKQIQDFLVSRGISVWVCSAWEGEQARAQLNNTDLIISVGGDGTILRAAHVAAPEMVPITGVNLGKLGFMTELGADETIDKLPSLLAGEGWIDERAMLEAEIAAKDREAPRRFHALNDIVVARGAISRLVRIEVTIDSQFFTTYKADGVIAATATGSTGYSLAAGGPILPPQSEDFLLVSIIPHLSPTYPLVLPATSEVQLRVSTVHEATLSVDGYINVPLADGATIEVRHSPHKIRFLRIHPQHSFYSSLEQKLRTEKR